MADIDEWMKLHLPGAIPCYADQFDNFVQTPLHHKDWSRHMKDAKVWPAVNWITVPCSVCAKPFSTNDDDPHRKCLTCMARAAGLMGTSVGKALGL